MVVGGCVVVVVDAGTVVVVEVGTEVVVLDVGVVVVEVVVVLDVCPERDWGAIEVARAGGTKIRKPATRPLRERASSGLRRRHVREDAFTGAFYSLARPSSVQQRPVIDQLSGSGGPTLRLAPPPSALLDGVDPSQRSSPVGWSRAP